MYFISGVQMKMNIEKKGKEEENEAEWPTFTCVNDGFA